MVLCVCQVLGESNIPYEYSDQKPWPLVYTLYPFYNSETLLEVWRGDKTIDISTNVVSLDPRAQERTLSYSDNLQRNGTSLNAQDNLSYVLNEAKDWNEEQLPQNRQRLHSHVCINNRNYSSYLGQLVK